MHTIRNVHQLAMVVANGAYAWPGGYPIYFLAADGEPVCFQCVKQNKAETYAAFEEGGDREWLMVVADINWEDPDKFCAHCENRIESAYAEEEVA